MGEDGNWDQLGGRRMAWNWCSDGDRRLSITLVRRIPRHKKLLWLKAALVLGEIHLGI